MGTISEPIDMMAKTITEAVNESMLASAEPFIEKALKDIEIEMRKTCASRLIGLIESNLSIDRFGTDIRVTIRQVKEV